MMQIKGSPLKTLGDVNKRITVENIGRCDILAFRLFVENPETDLEQCFQG